MVPVFLALVIAAVPALQQAFAPTDLKLRDHFESIHRLRSGASGGTATVKKRARPKHVESHVVGVHAVASLLLYLTFMVSSFTALGLVVWRQLDADAVKDAEEVSASPTRG